MKIKSIIFFALAVVLAVVGVFSTNTAKETATIGEAVYVADGKVLAENEGKVVIVPGKVEAAEPFVDTLTGVEIPHIKATRTVEIYEMISMTDEDGDSYYALGWNPTIQEGINQFDEKHSTQLIANCRLGEFEIDENIIKNISASEQLHDIDGKGPAAKGYTVRMHKNVTYVSKLDYMPDGGEEKQYGWAANARYSDYEGFERISYTIPSETNAEYTLIGRQQGNKLVYDKNLGMQAAFGGVQTMEQLTDSVKSGGIVGAVVAWVLAAFCVALGIFTMKKKEN